MTQKQIIIQYLQSVNDWVPSYKLRAISTKSGWIGHQGDRRCRELAKDGKLEHKIEGKYSYYRTKPLKYERYNVVDSEGRILKIINLPK